MWLASDLLTRSTTRSLTMPFELDHLYILATPGAPEAERLIALGLTEGSPNVHPGQGTANRRFYFDNAMLELIFVTDEAEARSAAVALTRLWERSRWRQTAVSPIGLCLRTTEQAPPPFPVYDYQPAYLPSGGAIPIARGTLAVEPMVFINPYGIRPDSYPPERREPLEHALGVHAISAVQITSAGCEPPSDPLYFAQRQGIVTYSNGAGHLLELTFDDGTCGGQADLRPELPLVLRW
jgi:hypothetical protein